MPIEHRLYMVEKTLAVLEFFEAYGAYWKQEEYEIANGLMRQSCGTHGTYHLIVAGAMDMGLIPNPVDHPIAFHNHLQRIKKLISILRNPDLEPDELIMSTEKVYLESASTQEDATSRGNGTEVGDSLPRT